MHRNAFVVGAPPCTPKEEFKALLKALYSSHRPVCQGRLNDGFRAKIGCDQVKQVDL